MYIFHDNKKYIEVASDDPCGECALQGEGCTLLAQSFCDAISGDDACWQEVEID